MYVTIDIETTGLNRFKDRITFIGIGVARDPDSKIYKGYILDMSKPRMSTHLKVWWMSLKEIKLRLYFKMVSLTHYLLKQPMT